MKSLTIFLTTLALAVLGCHQPTHDSVATCRTNDSGIFLENDADVPLNITIYSAPKSTRGTVKFPTILLSNSSSANTLAYTFPMGLYEVIATDSSGKVYEDTFQYFDCDYTYQFQFTPFAPTPTPLPAPTPVPLPIPVPIPAPNPLPTQTAELDIINNSSQFLRAIVDGYQVQMFVGSTAENLLVPGQLGRVFVSAGTHSIQVIQDSNGTTLDSDTITFIPGYLYTRDIQPAAGILEIENNSGDTLHITVDGALQNVIVGGVTYSSLSTGDVGRVYVSPGTHSFAVIQDSSGTTIDSDTINFLSDYLYPRTEGPVDAELDIENHTGEDLRILIDGNQQFVGSLTLLPPGQTGQFNVPPGTHTIDVIQDDTGVSLDSESINFTPAYLYTRVIASTDPVVQVENNFLGTASPLQYGDECIIPLIDGSLAAFEICQGNIGVFTIDHASHHFEIQGTTSGSDYVNDLSTVFPENYTTVFNIH